MTEVIPYNSKIADKLAEVASILRSQGADPFRVKAYLRAAEMIRGLSRPLDEIVENEGAAGVDALPGIGQTLCRIIFQLVKTGRLPMLDRLRGSLDPIEVLASVPGVGTRTAELVHDELGVDTLEEFEVAAYDGRLEKLKGFGPKRLRGIRDSLAARLGRILSPTSISQTREVPIDQILDVDREYRQNAAAGKLAMITPRRLNPRRERWLPILHTSRGDTRYTALFSNTALAHELGRTHDWVVIYLETDHTQRQFTVVTVRRGPLSGKRVIRGCEQECIEHYLSVSEKTARTVDKSLALAG